MKGSGENPTQLEWLDLRRLQEYAAVSERTLRGWIHDPADPLPASRVRGKILVRRSEFDLWLERHKVMQVDFDVMVRVMVEGFSSGR